VTIVSPKGGVDDSVVIGRSSVKPVDELANRLDARAVRQTAVQRRTAASLKPAQGGLEILSNTAWVEPVRWRTTE
jgi:hypothetical protein